MENQPPILEYSPEQKPRVPRSVVTLGWVSFFTDMASEMIYPLIPLFVVQTLGSSPTLLGLIDGVAEGISSGLRWIGGALSDRTGKRKPFIFAGYFLSALSKPIMGLAAFFGGWPVFMTGRCTDRLGKSIRTAARDALIADHTDPSIRGAAFGLHRAMDTAGAVAGPLIGWLLLYLYPNINLGWVFIVAVAPGLISALLVILAVKEKRTEQKEGKPPPIFQKFPSAFWPVLIVMSIFALANSSDSFLMLRSSELGLSRGNVILAFTLYNVVYALASSPIGKLSDKIGKRPVIATGWVIYGAVYLVFGITQSSTMPWILMACYGLYQAMAEGVSKALISDIVPSHQRAGAIGLIATATGFSQLIGSVIAGATWTRIVPGTHLLLPFAIAAALAIFASVLFLAITRKHKI